MTSTPAIANLNDQQRAGIRRTAWLVGGLAFFIFVLFFLKQFFWH